jgi:hypothetical protein
VQRCRQLRKSFVEGALEPEGRTEDYAEG